MSSNVTETPVVNNIEVPTKAEETPRQNQADTTPKDATSQVATPRVEAEKTAAAENQTAQSTKQEEKKVLGLAELTTLTNRVDEILLRSSSATLVSQRNLSSSLDVSYLSGHKTVTVETTKTSANPLYTSHVHTVASPTYSLPSYRSDVDLLRSIQNYQVKTVHGVESITRSAPVQYHHVEEVRSATYPSYSYNQYQVGYDRQKLDQIIARIQGTTPRTHTHTLEVVKNHSAPVDYRFHQASETKKSSRPQKESFKYIEADEDSFIQEAKSAQTQKYEEQVEVESPTKKRSINKRQEILSAKKQNPSAREVNSPSPNKAAPVEERQKGQSPYVAEQDKNEEKNDLIMLSKKPTLRNSYYFGNEQRRGGSTLLQDGRHRE